MTTLSAHLHGVKKIRAEIALLSKTPQQRKRLNQNLARKVSVYSKKRIREQRDLNGTAWAARKSKSRKKMLAGLRRKMKESGTPEQAKVYFSDRSSAVIAKAHQVGHKERVTAQQNRKRLQKASDEKMATRKTAKSLKLEGFKRRRDNGKGYKNCSLKWITENVSQKKAGAILNSMRGDETKDSWIIDLPARSFLGVTKKEREQLIEFVFDDTTKHIKKR